MTVPVNWATAPQGAGIGDDGQYRYWLRRTISMLDDRGLVFVMLNPSTADAREDDPTLRRCRVFASLWGFGRLGVVNLFAHRATDPKELRRVADPVGPLNDSVIRAHCERASLVVAAWGIHGNLYGRDREVLGLLADVGQPVRCLGLTRDGSPRHPLYVRGDAACVAYPQTTRQIRHDGEFGR